MVVDFNERHGDDEAVSFWDDSLQSEVDLIIATFDDFLLGRLLVLLSGEVA